MAKSTTARDALVLFLTEHGISVTRDSPLVTALYSLILTEVGKRILNLNKGEDGNE